MITARLACALALAAAMTTVHAADLRFRPGEGDFHWASFDALKAMRLEGERLTVFGPWTGPDQVIVESVLAYFAAATGADVRYTGFDSFEQQIRIGTEAGSAPAG